ncbi:MAG TPA: GatB/YqeY domain-containing protein [Candidatus Atopostipes pullistercoris]|uniref:GatB/YqeY domain-containing protein n=1 Tax=Candidatus Atopostipes pullistercoris TaxID=2838467 RepID=A0A9D2JXW5_9LACT|nr:GatB/YqeY domain-containing protein [Candidatus Atopostipes pullistercoris]
MSILDQLNEDMKAAMKAKEKERLTTIRMVKAALQNEKIAKGRELTPDEEITILSREKKQRMDSYEEFSKAGREDLVEKLEKELEVVNQYLPEQLSDDEVRSIVKETIDEVGAESMKDMGKVMTNIMPKVAGAADGSKINQMVKEELSNH